MKSPTSSKQRERQFRIVSARAAETPPSSDGQPDATPATPSDRRRYLHQYVRWLWPYRFSLGGILLLALAVAGLDLVWPLAIKYLVDTLNDTATGWPAKLARLNRIGWGVIGLLVVKQAIDSTRSYRVAVLNAKVVFRLRRRLFDRLIHLPLSAVQEMKAGGIVSRLSGDVDAVSGLVQMAIISPGVAAIRVVLTLAILMALSWQLALAALVALPPLALSSYLWLRRVRPIYRSMREDHAVIDGRVTETFGGLRVVRAFRREEREGKSYAVGHHTVIRKALYATRLELVLEAVWGLLIPATSLVLIWYGGWLISRGEATMGTIFAFQIFAALLLPPIWALVQSVSTTQRSLAAMERIFAVLQMRPDKPDAPDAVDAPAEVREVTFDHVRFEYRPDVPVIRDFTLSVPGGATVALVGPSGAGKTTLTDLVARFHDPTAGRILLNGIDLRQLRLKSYRALLAIVQQETFLFDGTVRENIAYGRRGASESDIIDAARRANAHAFIEKLPEGYDTLIGERGTKLSGGQRQRISIARAILADPQILILDEATSNLDTESEQLIQASLQELFRGRTTFVIAHRLSTITHADLIVVLDHGRIVETGTHEQLLGRRGMYFDMVERQRSSFDVLAEAE